MIITYCLLAWRKYDARKIPKKRVTEGNTCPHSYRQGSAVLEGATFRSTTQAVIISEVLNRAITTYALNYWSNTL